MCRCLGVHVIRVDIIIAPLPEDIVIVDERKARKMAKSDDAVA